MKIMTGILAPEEGDILVNGVPLSRMGIESYRALIGTMLQEDYLFSGSLFDNISMFDSQADAGRVTEAAQLALIHDDIMRMPMGYQSLVGGMGSNVSGGQKQRILLARALYKRAVVPVFGRIHQHVGFRDRDEGAARAGSTAGGAFRDHTPAP